MGTAKSYDGSGGRWRDARRNAEELARADADGLDAEGIDALVQQLVGTSLNALGWHGPAVRQSGGGGADGPGTGGVPARPSSGDGRASGRRGSTGLQTPEGRAAAARAGAAALRAASRLAGGGPGGLPDGIPELGISHAQLAAADPFEQCALIVDAVREGNTLADDAIAAANSDAVLAIITSQAEPEEAVRMFMVELLFHIVITEVGQTLRQKAGGEASVRQEQRIRDCVDAVVGQLPLLNVGQGERVTATELTEAIDSGLTRLYDIFLPGETP